MEWWIPVLVLGEFAFTTLIIWIVLRYRAERARQLGEERFRLLERFPSAEQLDAFLSTERGSRFLALFEPARRAPVERRAVAVIGVGVVLLALGYGFQLLSGAGRFDDGEAFRIPAVLVASLGVGIVVAGLLAIGAARRWPDPKPGGGE